MAKNEVVENVQGIDVENGEGFTFDMNAVEESKFEVLPKGTYDVVIEKLDYKLSKSSDMPMWAIQFNVQHPEYTNRKLFTFMSFSPKAIGMSKGALATFAPELITLSNFNPKLIAEEQVLIGRAARVKVAIEKDENGDDRNTIKGYVKPTANAGGGFAL